jgi:hypothetical protein
MKTARLPCGGGAFGQSWQQPKGTTHRKFLFMQSYPEADQLLQNSWMSGPWLRPYSTSSEAQ